MEMRKHTDGLVGACKIKASAGDWLWKTLRGFTLALKVNSPHRLSTSEHICEGNIEDLWGDLKAIGSVFLSPAEETMQEQLFELEDILSVRSHVCPPDWMSCIGGGLTLCSQYRLSVHFSQRDPYVTKAHVQLWW